MFSSFTDLRNEEDGSLISELTRPLFSETESVTPSVDFLLLLQGGKIELLQGDNLLKQN